MLKCVCTELDRAGIVREAILRQRSFVTPPTP
jgi:hypothetical protein